MGEHGLALSSKGRLTMKALILFCLVSVASVANAANDVPNRTMTDGKLFAEIYAACMHAVTDPGVFIEESCRTSARVGSQIEIQWDDKRQVWVRAVEL
jgi:hypothetical protein